MLWMGIWIHHHVTTGNHHTYCWPIIYRVRNFLGHSHSWAPSSHAKVHWLRLQTHMEGFPSSKHKHKMLLRILLCKVWAYGSTIMSLLVTTTESSSQLGTIKLWHGGLVEAADPHGRVPISASIQYQVLLRS